MRSFNCQGWLDVLTKAGTAHGIMLVEFENGDHGFDAL